MLTTLALAVSLAAAPAAASENPTTPVSTAAETAAPSVAEVAPKLARELQQKDARALEQKEAATERSVAADPFQRGSFWWYVGVIVVAGVILTVLLN